MLFDTDVLVWVLRGSAKAADAVTAADGRALSVVAYMELLQGARDNREAAEIKQFLTQTGFEMLPLTENIGHRAAVYMEEYALSAGICLADALTAATAVENGLALCTANRKHYRPIRELTIRQFRP